MMRGGYNAAEVEVRVAVGIGQPDTSTNSISTLPHRWGTPISTLDCGLLNIEKFPLFLPVIQTDRDIGSGVLNKLLNTH
jgi:hypothetical protein